MTKKEIMAAYRYAYKMAGDGYENQAPAQPVEQPVQAPAPAPAKRPSLVNGIGRAIRWGQAARGVYDNALTPEQRAAIVQAGQTAAAAAQNGVNRVVNPDRHAAGQAGVNAVNGMLNKLDRHNQNLQNGTLAPAPVVPTPNKIQETRQKLRNNGIMMD